MSDRIISEEWALIRDDGKIAGDMECHCTYPTRELAEADANEDREWCKFLREVNGGTLRVAKIRTVEVIE